MIPLALVGVDLPEVASDLYRPSFDGGPFLTVESAEVPEGGVAGLQVGWGRSLLRLRLDDELVPVVRDAVAVHVGARFARGPLQVGVTAPGYPIAQVAGETRTVLGDPTLEVKVAAGPDRWHYGGTLRLGTSLGARASQLGFPGPFLELGAVGQFRSDRVTVAANAGLRVVPAQDLLDVRLNDVVFARVGASVRLVDRWSVGLECVGQAPVTRDGGSVPIEGLLQVQRRLTRGSTLQLGVGRGLSSGVGAPAWRAVVGVGFGENG